MKKLSTLGAFKVKLANALGLSLPGIIKLTIGDLAAQREKQRRTRRLPRYNAGNPYGDNIPREFQDYGLRTTLPWRTWKQHNAPSV